MARVARGSLSCGKYTIRRKPEALSWKWWPNLEKSERPCRSHRIWCQRHSCGPCQFSRHPKLWRLPPPGCEAAVPPSRQSTAPFDEGPIPENPAFPYFPTLVESMTYRPWIKKLPQPLKYICTSPVLPGGHWRDHGDP